MCKLSFHHPPLISFYYIFILNIFIRLFFNPGAEENYPMMHEEIMFPVLFVPVSVRVNGNM